MVDYIRHVIYLNEFKNGNKQFARSGFARLERRDGIWRLTVIPEENSINGQVPLYVIGKKADRYTAFCVGESAIHTPVTIRLSSDAMQFIREQQEVCGILIGTKEHYLAGNCQDGSGEITYDVIESVGQKNKEEQMAEAEEVSNTENQEQPEVRKEAEHREEPEARKEAETQEEPEKKDALKNRRKTHFQPMYPFEDDELDWCYQIEPKDFGCFPAEQWHLMSNTFLLQGYYNYRHLLFAHKKGKNYIGVPGQFHRREQYLASRFGFPQFKGTQKKRVTLGDFGYWMREIQDFEQK